MPILHQGLDLFLHLDKHLNDFASAHQVGVYVLLAVIVFCETGLVVWPFLPGDSLLFAVGALAAASGSPISLPLMMVILCVAANCGDILNYTIGRRIGPRIFLLLGHRKIEHQGNILWIERLIILQRGSDFRKQNEPGECEHRQRCLDWNSASHVRQNRL